MVILLFPTKEETYAPYITDYLDADYLAMLPKGRLRLMRACDERGWRCIDMAPYFRTRSIPGKQSITPSISISTPAATRSYPTWSRIT